VADWYLAPSLVALRTEINRRWPNRDKRSDGAKGDDAHAIRDSDHNPDWSAGGVVRAIDVDKDGMSVAALLDALTGDDRVAYVIWSGRMMRSYPKTIGNRTYKPWEWAPYTGPNAHTGHVHVSILRTRSAETNTSAWFKAAQPEDDDMSAADVRAVNAYTEKRLDDYFTWMAKNVRQQLAPLKQAVAELAADDEPAAAAMVAAFDVPDLPKPAPEVEA
jgi:hypothetical protein